MARNSENKPCPVFSDDAKCFCLMGAIARVYDSSKQPTLRIVRADIMARFGESSIGWFNDKPETNYEAVIALCKKLDI